MADVMIALVFVIMFLVFLPLLVYMLFFGFDRMLRSRVRARLLPGEVATFESSASGGRMSMPSFFFTLGQGYLIVTAQSILFGTWILPPFWKRIREISLAEVDEVTSFHLLRRTQVVVTVKGKKTALLPVSNRFWPFGKDVGPQLLDTIRHGTAAGT